MLLLRPSFLSPPLVCPTPLSARPPPCYGSSSDRRLAPVLLRRSRLTFMLRKTLAGLLLMLTALPFTAPFATVDMPTLLGTRAASTPQQTSFAPSIEDTSHALVAPSARTRMRSLLRLDTHVGSRLVAVPAVDIAARLDSHTLPPAHRSSQPALRI